jgi:hypothetical protein
MYVYLPMCGVWCFTSNVKLLRFRDLRCRYPYCQSELSCIATVVVFIPPPDHGVWWWERAAGRQLWFVLGESKVNCARAEAGQRYLNEAAVCLTTVLDDWLSTVSSIRMATTVPEEASRAGWRERIGSEFLLPDAIGRAMGTHLLNGPLL